MYNAEQIQAVRRRQVETLLGLAGKSFEGVERLIALNLRTVRSSIDEASQVALATVSARDVKSLIDARMAGVQPAVEKVRAYSRDFAEIVSSTGAELTRVAAASAVDAGQQVLDGAEEMASDVAPVAEALDQAAADVATTTREAVQETRDTVQNAAADIGQTSEAVAESAASPSIAVSADAPAKTPARSRRSAS